MGLRSQFYDVENIADIAVVLAVVPQERRVSLGRGMASAQRGLDVTIFHELVHYLHFLSNKAKYKAGTSKYMMDRQYGDIMHYLTNFFLTRADTIWSSLGSGEMRSWIQVNDFCQASFLLEDMRTVWGDPSSNCLLDLISESLYIYQRHDEHNGQVTIDNVRFGYVDEIEFKPTQLEKAINDGQPIKGWFDMKFSAMLNKLGQERWDCQCERCQNLELTRGCCSIF